MYNIFVPRSSKDGWVADLSDGRRLSQHDMEIGGGSISGWLALKDICEKQNVDIINLELIVGAHMHVSIENPLSARGFFQAQRQWFSSNDDPAYSSDPDWHWRGIGRVDDDGIDILWLIHASAPIDAYNGQSLHKIDVNGIHVGWALMERRPIAGHLALIMKRSVVPAGG